MSLFIWAIAILVVSGITDGLICFGTVLIYNQTSRQLLENIMCKFYLPDLLVLDCGANQLNAVRRNSPSRLVEVSIKFVSRCCQSIFAF